MGITVHYRGEPRDLEDGETLQDLRTTMERIAMDSAKLWSSLLGLPEPELIKGEDHAWIQVNEESEGFSLWNIPENPKKLKYLWHGYTKTQYAPHLVHVQVIMMAKDLIRSGLFKRGTVHLRDDADFFGDWFDIEGMIGSILENAAIIEGLTGTIEKLGWDKVMPKEIATNAQDASSADLIKGIIKAGLDERDLFVYEKAKAITELEQFKFAAKVASNRINERRNYEYDMTEPLLKRLQKDLVLWFYQFSETEIMNMPEEMVLRFTEAAFDMRAIEWKVAPVFNH